MPQSPINIVNAASSSFSSLLLGGIPSPHLYWGEFLIGLIIYIPAWPRMEAWEILEHPSFSPYSLHWSLGFPSCC